ncbi:HNH endonuclease [Periweissella cryptocerci]|uniref:HNH endonuclease n=1 Tax=Periweissella cryptocerci TaxID=2506420 RepID=A0A4P6YX48_9LACO|nr:HNH endonuclease [Periweissella cryptocerci]
MKEIWKSVPDFEGLYEVSNLGRIKSPEGKITESRFHGERRWKERIIKQKTDKKGYKRVSLYKDKTQHTFLVHRIVAKTFLGTSPKGKEIINHIDGNPSNNVVDNLEWIDYVGNLRHAFENGLNKSEKQIVLVNVQTNIATVFRNMRLASEFLGKNHGYISAALNRKQAEIEGYMVFVKPF